MKKAVVFIALLFALSVGAQEYTILDTSVVSDVKLRTVKESVERLEYNLISIFDREQVQYGSMEYLSETRQLMNSIKGIVTQYEELFKTVDSLTFFRVTTDPYQLSTGQNVNFDYYKENNDSTSLGIIHQWDGIGVRIEALESNSEITNLSAVKEYRNLVKKRNYLEEIYSKIKAQ